MMVLFLRLRLNAQMLDLAYRRLSAGASTDVWHTALAEDAVVLPDLKANHFADRCCVRVFSSILSATCEESCRALNVATVEINEIGIRVIVQDAKCLQAIAFVQRELFDDYDLKETSLSFDIRLSILLECLTMFGSTGSAVSTRLCYAGYGSPLVLFLEEAGVVTDCEIRTLESTGVINFDLSRDNVINVVIFRTEILKEVWAELDASSDVLEILISPDEPYFRLTTFGNAGTVQVDYSKGSEMMETFQCKKQQKNSYKLPLIKQCSKALNLSSKVAMRTDQLGLICFQFLIRTEDGTATFVEYYCAPNLDD